MGWFDTDIENVFYSDETLDLAFNFLNEFSEIYTRDLNRKPTAQELEYLLKLSFRVNADERFLADFEEKKIEEVKFKVAKRKKLEILSDFELEVGICNGIDLEKFVYDRKDFR